MSLFSLPFENVDRVEAKTLQTVERVEAKALQNLVLKNKNKELPGWLNRSFYLEEMQVGVYVPHDYFQWFERMV